MLQKTGNRLVCYRHFVGSSDRRTGPLIRAVICPRHVENLADYQASKRRVKPERMGAPVVLDSPSGVLLKLPTDLPQESHLKKQSAPLPSQKNLIEGLGFLAELKER